MAVVEPFRLATLGGTAMATVTPKRATVDDLLRTEGKAELIGGRIVKSMPSGYEPSRIAFEIAVSLRERARVLGRGFAIGDGLGFTVPELPSGRESFCPDAAYHDGPPPARKMRFVDAAPTFAIEVRSENDYGPVAERAMAAKRADYFLAGTKVVWDVDPEAEVVHCYRGAEANRTSFPRGEIADAEPAVPGWTLAVDAIFG
jgi:Uma2 family endonuclease